MERIFSRVQPDALLHGIIRAADFTHHRQDISPAEEGLQLAFFRMCKGQTFRPHMHVPRRREIPITQECWIIARGSVLASYYDLNGVLLEQRILLPGDATITWRGGHTYEGLEHDACIFEVKTGPFVGVAQDKEYLD